MCVCVCMRAYKKYLHSGASSTGILSMVMGDVSKDVSSVDGPADDGAVMSLSTRGCDSPSERSNKIVGAPLISCTNLHDVGPWHHSSQSILAHHSQDLEYCRGSAWSNIEAKLKA